MPNWCHNTLTVSGEAGELARFVQAVRPSAESLRRPYSGWNEKWDGPKPPFEEYVADVQEKQPLSFETLVPQPSDDELRALESYQPCTMCGAYGTLPESEEQARERGARWYEWMLPSERSDRSCNVCGGSKKERVGMEGWYSWRLRAWGTKWDASFGEPFLALGSDEASVDETTAALGGTVTPTVAVYKFDTAWSPPTGFVESASEQFPELEFGLRFGEPGNGFAGIIRWLAGLTLEEEELAIEDVLAPEEMWF